MSEAPKGADKRIKELYAALFPHVSTIWGQCEERAGELDPRSPRHRPSFDKFDTLATEAFDDDFLARAPLELLGYPELAGRPDRYDENDHFFKNACADLAARHFSTASMPTVEHLLADKKYLVGLFRELTGEIATTYDLRKDDQRGIAESIPFPGPHHDLVCPLLEKLLRGEIEAEVGAIVHYIWCGLAVFDAAGKLDYDLYRATAINCGGDRLPQWPTFPSSGSMTDYTVEEGFKPPERVNSTHAVVANADIHDRHLEEFARQLTDEFLPELDEDKLKIIGNFDRFSGGEVLVHLAAAIERLDIKNLGEIATAGGRIGKFAGLIGLRDDDDHEDLVRRLKEFRPATLKLLLPYSGAGKPLLVAALELDKTQGYDFYNTLLAITKANHATLERSHHSPFTNNTDPINGTLDPAAIRNAAEGLEKKDRTGMIKMLDLPEDLSPANARFLFTAVFGDNDDKVRAGLKRHSQPAAKALGLLPLPQDETERIEEIQARYLALLGFEKACKKFGTERRANSAAATQVGLTNLARNAGFADADRLSWAIEARLASGDGEGDGASGQRRVASGDYEIVLDADAGGAPKLFVEKKGKALKSIPPAVRKTDDYKKLRETADHLKKQHSRLRNKLEQMLVCGEALEPEDLATMSRLPALRAFLPNLILRGSDAAYGIYDPDGGTFSGIDGAKVAPKPPMLFAHPAHLHADGKLSAWQRELVRRRIVQPIKQAFRELYLVTGAEREAEDASQRFAGRVLDARVAGRLLSSRGWLTQRGYEVHVHRRFRDADMEAVLELEEYPHYFTEVDVIRTAAVRFERNGDPIPFDQVPPLIFSEAMRDVDLAASVAYRGEDHWHSPNMHVRRRELLDAIVADFALQGVETDGKYATVKGQRASYRVHLDTGAIYIGSGNHICVVPDRSKAIPTDIYLPFTADDDPKLCEIVSRILMLINDSKIRDKVILEQIDEALAE